MGGDNTETTTQTSKPSNPMVDSTLTTLLGGLQNKYNAGEASGTPSAVNTGFGMQYSAAMNPEYMRGVSGATSELSDIASGKRFGMNDPGYAAMRAGLQDDVTTGVNATLEGSGRFGSTSHAKALTSELTKSLGGLDYGNFQNDQARQMQAISAMPGNFAAGQAPGAAVTGVGQQQQAAPWWNLGQASSVLAGTAGAGGTTQTMSQPATPWWQQVLGAGAVGSGIYKNVWGS
jgi:hypothetical protein